MHPARHAGPPNCFCVRPTCITLGPSTSRG